MADDNFLENEDQKPDSRLTSSLILGVIGVVLVIAAVIFYPQARHNIASQSLESAPSPPLETLPPAAPTLFPTAENTPDAEPEPEIFARTSQLGNLVLSIREGRDIHLFVYSPFLEVSGEGLSALPLTRLTTGSCQDITPSVSPDGRRIAFASNRNGPWDIYILDLVGGEITQFTDSLAYDGNPTWSPDGMWLAYESYHIDNLDIFIQSLEQHSNPIPLTNHPAADYAPDWSGQGRKISFVSTRGGDQEIWYADLDSPREDKAAQVPSIASQSVDHPTWTADGRYLTWSLVTPEGNHSLVTWDSADPDSSPVVSGTGDWAVWAGSAEVLYAAVTAPDQHYLTAYPGLQQDLQIMLPAVQLPGALEGISWVKTLYLGASPVPGQAPAPTPLWEPIQGEDDPDGQVLIQLSDLTAPRPMLVQDAASSYSALREEARRLAGWDYLAALENAYLGLDQPIKPGVDLNWLHTGRGISLDDTPRLAGWAVVLREEFGRETYWRVFLRANNQQGLQGKPLKGFPWDFSARYSGSNAAYESGGARESSVPPGYWIDFTALAAAYGWNRFPAEPYWQFSETASRYQYFAFKADLSLEEALLQLYSPDSIQELVISASP